MSLASDLSFKPRGQAFFVGSAENGKGEVAGTLTDTYDFARRWILETAKIGGISKISVEVYPKKNPFVITATRNGGDWRVEREDLEADQEEEDE